MRLTFALIAASLAMPPSAASADDLWTLPVGTNPHTLQMRGSAWRLAAEDSNAPGEPDSIFALPSGDELSLPSGGLDRLQRRELEADVQAPPAPLSDKLIFRFNLGVGLDSGLPSRSPMLSGSRLQDIEDYQQTRTYGFADTVAGTKGVGISGLNSYFAAHFRFSENFSNTTTALPSVYDKELQRPLVRSAYGEADGIFKHKLLKPVYLRAGRSYHYGLSVMQYDGAKIGYDTPALKFSLLGGSRTGLYGLDRNVFAAETEDVVAAYDFRVDFYEWKRWPVVVFLSSLNFDGRQHYRSGFALRWNRDVLLSSSLRHIDGKLARSDLQLRARISKVTTVNVQLNNRFRSDWSYGLLLVRTPDSTTDPRRFLDFGDVLPRSVLRIRYGTVLLRNLDVLLRGGAALDRRDRKAVVDGSSFSSSYAELGGAAEIRVRRSLRLGSSLSSRRYFLNNNNRVDSLIGGQPDTLPNNLGSTGVTSYWEGGLNLNYSPGARQFSANAEVYGRRYSLRSEFLRDNEADVRTGGRFGIEGWVKDRIRLKAEYDLTLGSLVMAPELRDLRALRVLMEGSF